MAPGRNPFALRHGNCSIPASSSATPSIGIMSSTPPLDPPPLSTGISGMDDILRGGFPRDCVYMVAGTPGTGKTTLALQFLLDGVCVMASLASTSHFPTRREIEGCAVYGWDLTGLNNPHRSDRTQSLCRRPVDGLQPFGVRTRRDDRGDDRRSVATFPPSVLSSTRFRNFAWLCKSPPLPPPDPVLKQIFCRSRLHRVDARRLHRLRRGRSTGEHRPRRRLAGAPRTNTGPSAGGCALSSCAAWRSAADTTTLPFARDSTSTRA